MRLLRLLRDHVSPSGVFGTLSIPQDGIGEPLVVQTAEDDWKDNTRRESCIPSGRYPLKRRWSEKHGCELFEIAGVPKRSDIEIHWGNTEEDVEGCVLVGLKRGRLKVRKDEDTSQPWVEKEAVLESKLAFERVMHALQGVALAEIVVEWSDGLP